ncbi:uroporphyrinogen decarboxylase family protein [Bianquea renquensis]|uniref:Uroporphyrinogen decarboxylase (URO-D) domain-containing protein n=1 Tax=Bianquea renquensis TaxID=2763661 RepID=A0A926I1B9_9FIRM|nr:uroporphyrinogen decarboxylase family protein [Bianquea renquensis]MBC8543125.1 hypothetical protein [Bianquea renquensis]
MSFENGMAALRLEMTDHVSRTEYSVLGHSKLIERVTGIDLSHNPTPEQWTRARQEFMRAWDFCFTWNILVHNSYLGPYCSSMGHAEYAEGGSDRNDNIHYLFDDEEEALRFDPFETLPVVPQKDMIRQFEENYEAVQRSHPDTVATTGIYITGMSGLIEIFGWDMLLTCCGSDPKQFGHLMNRYSMWVEHFFRALAASNVPTVMIHDDIVWTEGAFLAPEWYRTYIFPNYKRLFRLLKDAGKILVYTSDGNYSEFIDDIAEVGVDCFVMEPSTDMAYIAEKYGKTHSFIGNADTRILLEGDKDAIYREVKRCMDIGKKYPGFIMAVGNHIPANTPVDSCLYYDEYCKILGKR